VDWRITASRRSRPPRTSAQSARPSTCSAPVTTTSQVSASTPATGVPSGSSAALSYYRAVFDTSLWDPDRAELRRAAARPVAVPTSLLLGERDGCIAPEMAAGAENSFSGAYETVTLADCGHFIQLERPDAVAERAAAWFRRWTPGR
jgi:pimeloyl-ACP methyl ester carboxylesterase